VTLARAALQCGHAAVAVEWFGSALEEAPGLADAVGPGHRRLAIRAAVMAAVGSPEKREPEVERQRVEWRNRALQWLVAETNLIAALRTAEKIDNRGLRRALSQLAHAPDLASVREASAVSLLPEEERAAWAKAWAQVDALLERACERFALTDSDRATRGCTGGRRSAEERRPLSGERSELLFWRSIVTCHRQRADLVIRGPTGPPSPHSIRAASNVDTQHAIPTCVPTVPTGPSQHSSRLERRHSTRHPDVRATAHGNADHQIRLRQEPVAQVTITERHRRPGDRPLRFRLFSGRKEPPFGSHRNFRS
jgi:hypothetical protein